VPIQTKKALTQHCNSTNDSTGKKSKGRLWQIDYGRESAVSCQGINLMVQEQYWKEIHQLKTHINFIELQLEKAERIDRTLKIVLAITSSSSIGAWVIWNHLSQVWTGIIAFSQVVSAISPYLPYKNRIKVYSSLLPELEELMIQAEFKWHSIAEGKFTATEINKARFEIRATKQKSLKKYIETTIPIDGSMHQKAEASAREYLSNFYPT
jgi:hypothetical protein